MSNSHDIVSGSNEVIDKHNYSTLYSTLDAGNTGCCRLYVSISRWSHTNSLASLQTDHN